MSHLFSDYPREVDMRLRKVIRSMDELQRYVKAMNGKDNLTTTVYGFRELKTNKTRCEYSTAIIPHFVIDLDKGRAYEALGLEDDAEAGKRCTQDTRILVSHLLDNDIRHAVWFSGGGYHVWVMLDEIYKLPQSDLNDLLFSGRAMLNKWIKQYDLITVDPVVSFRPDRHIRIPNTYNFKRELWSIPVSYEDLSEGWRHITTKAQNPSTGMIVNGSKGISIEIVKRDPGNPFSVANTPMTFEADVEIAAANVKGIPMLPCLEAAACVKGRNPSHLPRVYLLMYLLDFFRGFTRPATSSKVKPSEILQKTHSFIADLQWSDYSPQVTRDMIIHGMNKQYLTPSCPKLYGAGLCVGKCPFYDGKGGANE